MNFKLFVEKTTEKPIIIISGVHGDEMAPVKAMKRFLHEHGSKNGFILLPTANPTAIAKHTRRGSNDKDMNRHFCDPLDSLHEKIWNKVEKCKLLIALHEWDGKGAFAYYSNEETKKIAKQFVDIASKEFGIAKPNGEKHLKEIKGGLLAHDDIKDFPRSKCSLESYAKEHGIDYVTTEIPVTEDINKRVKVYMDFLRMVVL